MSVTSQAAMSSETSSNPRSSQEANTEPGGNSLYPPGYSPFAMTSPAPSSTTWLLPSTSPSSPLYAGSPTIAATCVTATATRISCPASNGTTYTPAGYCIGDDESYMTDCGMDFAGVGLTALAGFPDVESCVAECSKDPTCIAIAFDTARNICYQRSSVVLGNATSKPTFIFAYNARYAGITTSSTTAMQTITTFSTTTTANSATPTILCPTDDGMIITTSDDSIWTVLCGQAYTGIVLALPARSKRQVSDKAPSADDCLNECEPQAECEGFTYDGGQCTLYSYINGSRSARLGTISARRLAQAQASSSLSRLLVLISDQLHPCCRRPHRPVQCLRT